MRGFPAFCALLLLLSSPLKSEETVEGLSGEEVAIEPINPHAQEVQQQKEQLLGLLAQVDERYGDVAASLRSIGVQIAESNQSLDKLRKEISGHQEQIDKLAAELSGQVKAAYAMGQKDRLKLMLNQQDPALSSRMMVYYDYINKSRLEKLANLQQTVRYLDQLDKEKQSQTELLERRLEQKKSEQVALDQARKERNELIARLNGDFSTEEEQLSLLKESENKLINLIGALEKETEESGFEEGTTNSVSPSGEDKGAFPKLTGDFSSLKGQLPLPVRGKLASMFENFSPEEMWKGVLINAHEGAEVKAIAKGRVVYAGSLKGYGLLTIVEHDKQFMTLYAFNQSLYKHKGDWVEAGDVVAAVGQSGGRSKSGLYFEIRKDGKAVDPLLWCRN